MLTALLCVVVGAFLPIIIMGINLSAEDANEKRIYYAIFAVVAIIFRLVWGGSSGGINFALIFIIGVAAVACYKAHEQVLSAVGRLYGIVTAYMQAISRMSLEAGCNSESEEGMAYSLSMKTILNVIFKIECFILVGSVVGLIKSSQGFALILGSSLYLAVMHGFLLRDETLLHSVESVRRMLLQKMNILTDTSDKKEELEEDDLVQDYLAENPDAKAIKKPTRNISSDIEDDEDLNNVSSDTLSDKKSIKRYNSSIPSENRESLSGKDLMTERPQKIKPSAPRKDMLKKSSSVYSEEADDEDDYILSKRKNLKPKDKYDM